MWQRCIKVAGKNVFNRVLPIILNRVVSRFFKIYIVKTRRRNIDIDPMLYIIYVYKGEEEQFPKQTKDGTVEPVKSPLSNIFSNGTYTKMPLMSMTSSCKTSGCGCRTRVYIHII